MAQIERTRARCRRPLAAIVLGSLAIGAAAPASAHPHVWVTVETTLLFENGSVSGFQNKWTFDENYTTMAVEGLDTNKDGIYSREELAELAKVNIEGLKEFGYFTSAKLGGKDIALEAPKDYWLEYVDAPPDPEADKLPKAEMLPRTSEKPPEPQGGVLSRLWDRWFGPVKAPAATAAEPARPKVLNLHFTLPLAQPVLTEATEFTFATYDPAFFIAFEMAKSNPVKLGPGAPPHCRLEVGTPEKSADDAQKLDEAFSQQLGQQNFGLSASKPVRLVCGPKS